MTTERPATDSHDAPLQVDLLGANQRLRDTLAMVMHGPAKARCALADGAAARAVIVNLDGVGAESEWARYRERHPDRPALVLTLDAAMVEHATATVMKPVRIDAFLAALDVIEAALRPGSLSALDTSRPPAFASATKAPAVPDAKPLEAMAHASIATHRNAAHEVAPANAADMPMEHLFPSRPDASLADAPTLVNDGAHTDPITEVLDSTAASLRLSTVTDAWRAVCGDAPDCDLDDPEQAAQRRCLQGTDLLDCLVGALATAHRERCDVGIRLHAAPLVVLDIREQRARLSVSMQQLEALCGVTMTSGALMAMPTSTVPAEVHAEPHGESHAAPAAHGDAAPDAADACEPACTLSIEALLWQVALWTYRGLLPAAAPLEQRVYLAFWPNLTRLAPIPNACRIAALLVRHPMQLARAAEALAIPQRQVFAFYGAAHAIGLMGTARREVDHLVAQTAPAADGRRALLARLATRIARDGRRADVRR